MKKILLDCDPGHDDAIAMLLAWGNPEVCLLGVTTVAGNQVLEKVTTNARALARVAGMTGVPFAAGAHRPLLGPQVIPEAIHGESGLDGPKLPSPGVELEQMHAVELMAKVLREHEPKSVTLVPTGALTNVALLARMYPELVERVASVTLMGGCVATGNMTPAAEFNILADPEAARIVFEERWPITMVGLDVTHKVLATKDRLDQLAAVDTDVAAFVVELIEFFGAAYLEEHGFPGAPLHDPLAVAAVIDPTLLRTIGAEVFVETQGDYARGQTIVDLRRTWKEDPSVVGVADAPGTTRHRVAVDVDQDRFWELLVDALRRLGNTGFEG